MLNQEKGNMKTVAKLCGILKCPSLPLPWQVAAHISNMGPWTQVPGGADLICKLLGTFVLTLSGAA